MFGVFIVLVCCCVVVFGMVCSVWYVQCVSVFGVFIVFGMVCSVWYVQCVYCVRCVGVLVCSLWCVGVFVVLE